MAEKTATINGILVRGGASIISSKHLTVSKPKEEKDEQVRRKI
jgi:hypothetical protein